MSQITLPWGGPSGKKCDWQHSMAHFRNPLYRRKKSLKNILRKPSCSQFCHKFRCHGNGGPSVKNAIGSIRWLILENPPIGAKISQKSFTQGELMPVFAQISLPWQRRSVGEKCHWQHSTAHPQKPPIGAKISRKCLTQAEL